MTGPSEPISIRMPTALLEDIKEQARRQGLPYQTLIKHWLADRLQGLESPGLPPRTTVLYVPTRRRLIGIPATELVDTAADSPRHRRRER